MLAVHQIELDEANEMIARWHRHHKPVTGHRFSLGCFDTEAGTWHGAVVIARPVARLVNARTTIEVTRLVTDGTPHVCSKLYAAAARVAREMGYAKIQTYVLQEETGVSLNAARWTFDGISTHSGQGWNNRPGRRDDQPKAPKGRWVKTFKGVPVPPDALVSTKDSMMCDLFADLKKQKEAMA